MVALRRGGRRGRADTGYRACTSRCTRRHQHRENHRSRPAGHSDAAVTTPPRSPHPPILFIPAQHPREPPTNRCDPGRACALDPGGQRSRGTRRGGHAQHSHPPDLDTTFARQGSPPIRRPETNPTVPPGVRASDSARRSCESGDPPWEIVGIQHRIHPAASGEPQPHSITTRHDDLLTQLSGPVAPVVVAAPGLVGVGVGQILLHPGRRR